MGPKRVSRAERGRAASWPTRRRPSRRRAGEQVGVQPQGGGREVRQRLSGLGRQQAAGAEPGPGPGGGEPPGHGEPAGQAELLQAAVEVGHERALAAEQMAAAGKVDGEPVHAVDHDARAVAGAPQAERGQLRGIGRGLGLAHQEFGAGRARIGQRHARHQAECLGGRPDRRQPRHAAHGRDQRQGRGLRPGTAGPRGGPSAACAPRAIRAARGKDSAGSSHRDRSAGLFLFCSSSGRDRVQSRVMAGARALGAWLASRRHAPGSLPT